MTKPVGKKKELVPKLRFPEFRDEPGWDAKILGNLCNIQTGKKDANEGSDKGIYPFFTCAADHIHSDTYSFDAEAILIAGNANVGQAKYYRGKFEAYQRTYVLTDFSEIFTPYLYAILNANLRSDLMEQVQVSAMSYIRLPMLQKYQIAAPTSLSEQQKIAECLSSLDELIGAESQKLEAMKTHKKGLMQDLFPREGGTVPRIRFAKFCDAPEWVPKTLVDACQMQAGKFVSASEIMERPEIDLFPCYGGNGLRGYTKTYTHSGKYPLIGRQGALCGNVKFVNGKFHATEHAIVATRNGGIDTDWLYYALEFLNLNRFATGQAQPGLSVDVLEKVPLAIPIDEYEQKQVAALLGSLDELLITQTNKIKEIKTYKDGIMQQLFPSRWEEVTK
jgi:type I restriction enzyme, S subunit